MTEQEKRQLFLEDENAPRGGAVFWLLYLLFLAAIILLLIELL